MQVGVLQQRSTVGRGVNARHLSQTLHSVQQAVGNTIVFLQTRRAHPGGSGPQATLQHEVEHAIETPPLGEERIEGPPLYDVLLDSLSISLPNAEGTGDRCGRGGNEIWHPL